MFAKESETMGIVNEYAEAVFLLEFDDLVENSHRTGHAEHTLGDKKHTSAAFLCFLAGSCENFLTILDIVVTILVLAADVQTDTVQKAGMGLCIIHDDIVACGKTIDCGDDSLIAEVEKEGILLLLEISEHLLKFLMESGMA